MILGTILGGALLLSSAVAGPQQQAPCSYPILSLGAIGQQAPVAVLGDVVRERPDGAGGYSSVIQVRGVIKGRAPGPEITLAGLGHLGDDCTGGPRLRPGGRYVLFIAGQQLRAGGTIWSLFDFDGGVYQVTPTGTYFPPGEPVGTPQLQPIPPAEFIRDVGSVSHADGARIEALVDSLSLSETIDVQSRPVSHHSWIPHTIPSRSLSLAIAAGAVMLAGLVYLLWNAPPRPPGRV